MEFADFTKMFGKNISVVKINIIQIHMFFIDKTMNLSSEIFNEQTRYHILPEFGYQEGYLRRLLNEIREGKFHDVEMI